MRRVVVIKILLMAFLFYAVAASVNATEAVNFMQTYFDDNGAGGFDADSVSVKNSGSKISAAVTTMYYYSPTGVAEEIARRQRDFLPTKGWKNLSYKTMQEEFLQRPVQYCIFSITYYDKNGKILEQDDFKASFRSIEPDTFQDTIHQAVFAFLGY